MENARPAATRCLLVWGGASAGVGAGAAWAAPVARAGLAPEAIFPAMLEGLCAAALLACLAWLWLVTTLVVLEAAGHRQSSGAAPAGVRRAVLAACGVALSTGLSVPATATPGPVQLDHTGRSSAAILRGLPLPERPTDRSTVRATDRRATAAQPAAPAPPPGPQGADVHVVRPGDTLWDLAAASLPAAAGPDEIARRWHAIWAANRSVIGADPDLIVPAQRLHLP